MTNNYTNQIIAILKGEVDIKTVSQEVIDIMLADFPYSPYSHLIHYLKAKASNNPETKTRLHKLATYSPDRAWLQEVLKTSFQEIEESVVEIEEAIPSEGKDPNLDKMLFEFDFNHPSVEQEADVAVPITSVEPEQITQEEKDTHNIDEEDSKTVDDEFPSSHINTAAPSLSSYTQWLKSFNGPEQDEMAGEDSEIEEKQPESPKKKIALEKNTRKDDDLFGGIITETLAELLANQGQTEKAILMYERLTLIFPDKSAFFAAKIDQLNNNIA